MRMKLWKIVHDYDIERDMIKTVEHYKRAAPDDLAVTIVTSQDCEWVTQRCDYTSREWNDIITDIENRVVTGVELVKAIDEVLKQ